ncbi:MAG: AI-2E family transporter [Deltaproteobacteria bacterium]|nr:AI-2E family transporter [Deltaproteobacteria bacterium]
MTARIPSDPPPPSDRSRISQQIDEELPKVAQSAAAPVTARGRRLALGVLLLLSFLMVARIAAPLWVGIAFGTMVAFVAQPTYRRLVVRLGHRRQLAAVITTVIVGVLTTVGGGLTVYLLTTELFSIIAKFQGQSGADWLPEPVVQLFARFGVERAQVAARVSAELGKLAGYAAEVTAVLLQTTTSAFLELVIGLMTMYYVLLEWPRIPVHIERVMPLDPRHTRALILEFRDVGRAAMIGTLATALIQGTLGWIGYALAKFPQAFLWGMFTALASFLPVLGTFLVWLPIGIWLLATGRPLAGAFVLAWGFFIVVGLVDTYIRPRMVRGHGSTNQLLMLVALLGGLEVFGLAGLIVGPIFISLFLAILRIYEREITDPNRAPPSATD